MSVIWKDIPGYPKYQISELGDVRVLKQSGYRSVSPHDTVRGYIRVNIRDENDQPVKRQVHRLVALAFIGDPPDEERIYVNHKDGITWNNHFSNLEWVTSQENSIHAMENKLAGYTLGVRIYDTVTGHLELCPSMVSVSKRFGLTVDSLKRYLARYPDLKYNDRFLFEPVVDDHDPINFEHCQVIVAYDYVGRKTFVADNLGLMSILTGVLPPTIGSNLRKGGYRLIGGYVFKYQKDTTPFPEHDIEEARTSREKYLKRKHYDSAVVVMNYTTGEVTTYPTQVAAAEATGVRLTLVSSRIKHGSLVPTQGFSFKREQDPTEFPTKSLEEIAISFMESRVDGKGVKVTDLETKQTKFYPSIKALSDAIGATRSSITAYLGKKVDKPFKKRFFIQYV